MDSNKEKKDFLTDLDRGGMYQIANQGLAIFSKTQHLFSTTRQPFDNDYQISLQIFDDLVGREKERAKDGFPRKVKWRQILVAPGKIITIPHVQEDKLIHGSYEPKRLVQEASPYQIHYTMPDISEETGSGKGEVGEVVGNIPLNPHGDDGDGDGDGDGDEPNEAGDSSADHLEEEAFEHGKRISEALELPNLKEKIKKFPTDESFFSSLFNSG